ncbi:unnamed protein product [Ectocarpus sp. CCAP 1310/34]|nr:unnamed protein product [Ectocarpus sp. CCAP 1310/34]
MPFQTARDLFIFTVMLVAMGVVGLSNKNSQKVPFAQLSSSVGLLWTQNVTGLPSISRRVASCGVSSAFAVTCGVRLINIVKQIAVIVRCALGPLPGNRRVLKVRELCLRATRLFPVQRGTVASPTLLYLWAPASEFTLNWQPLVARMGNSMEVSQGSL